MNTVHDKLTRIRSTLVRLIDDAEDAEQHPHDKAQVARMLRVAADMIATVSCRASYAPPMSDDEVARATRAVDRTSRRHAAR